MKKLSEEYQQKEILLKNVIVFSAVIVMVILYFGKILSILRWFFSIILPFIIGLILAFILDVIAKEIRGFIIRVFHLKLSKRVKTIANIGSIFFLAIILSIFVIFILPQIYNSIQSIFMNLPFALNNIYQWLLKVTRHYPSIHDWLRQINESLFASGAASEGNGFLSMLGNDQMTNIFTSIMSLISTTFNTGLQILISVMFSIIVLFNRELMVKEMHGILRAYLPEKEYLRVNKGIDIVLSTFTAYISGTCLECLILGTLITIASALLHLPYAFLAGVLFGACALVPMFGAFFGGICSALIIAIQSPVGALYFMVMFVIIQQIEGNLIYPNVVGKSVGLPPMYIIVAITIGGHVAGILGMILFIPISSCLYQIIKEDAKMRIKEKETKAQLK
ncbi:MAG: AI-2E family transporter [Bacillota bacterium]|nr:AI-2E family transporter [Bacillota bacterium]